MLEGRVLLLLFDRLAFSRILLIIIFIPIVVDWLCLDLNKSQIIRTHFLLEFLFERSTNFVHIDSDLRYRLLALVRSLQGLIQLIFKSRLFRSSNYRRSFTRWFKFAVLFCDDLSFDALIPWEFREQVFSRFIIFKCRRRNRENLIGSRSLFIGICIQDLGLGVFGLFFFCFWWDDLTVRLIINNNLLFRNEILFNFQTLFGLFG